MFRGCSQWGQKISKDLAIRRLSLIRKWRGEGVETQAQKTDKATAVEKMTTVKGEDTLKPWNYEGFVAGGKFWVRKDAALLFSGDTFILTLSPSSPKWLQFLPLFISPPHFSNLILLNLARVECLLYLKPSHLVWLPMHPLSTSINFTLWSLASSPLKWD